MSFGHESLSLKIDLVPNWQIPIINSSKLNIFQYKSVDDINLNTHPKLYSVVEKKLNQNQFNKNQFYPTIK